MSSASGRKGGGGQGLGGGGDLTQPPSNFSKFLVCSVLVDFK